jgi:triosephosphate isomerase
VSFDPGQNVVTPLPRCRQADDPETFMSKTRRPLIAGNWKMNNGGQDGLDLARAIAAESRAIEGVDIVVAPPSTLLWRVAQTVEQVAPGKVGVAAQNLHQEPNGAFTGELSASMLLAAGASWVIIGHSERRQYFGETDAGVRAKTDAAFAAKLLPIVCIGETLEEREAGRTLDVVYRQLDAVVPSLARHVGVGAIAYEPVWAIGTGKVATNEQAQEVHAAIRQRLAATQQELGRATRVLYGGSVKADNALGLLRQADIDGALVGGASLKADGFLGIINAARQAL